MSKWRTCNLFSMWMWCHSPSGAQLHHYFPWNAMQQNEKMESSLYLFMTNLMSHILSSWMSTCKLEILFYLFQCFGYFVNVRGRTWVWHIENSKYILKLLLWYPTNRTHPHHLLVCWLTDCQTKWLARLVD